MKSFTNIVEDNSMKHTLITVALGIKYYHKFSNESDNENKTVDIDTSPQVMPARTILTIV